MWTERRFISFDKAPIFYRRNSVSGNRKATLIIVHGMGEHGGRYLHVADYLGKMGIETVLPDLRGFGRSGGKRVCIKNFTEFFEDLGALHCFIDRHDHDTPLFILGHSLGGLIVSSYLAFHKHPKICGLILTSPLFGIAISVPAWRHFLAIAASYIWPDYTQSNRVEPDKLTHDREILIKYNNDPLIDARISARFYRELVRMTVRKNEISAKITCPILLQQAGQDVVVSAQASQDFYRQLGSADKEIDLYADLYHEILNETKREIVLSRIAGWLKKRIP